MLPFFPRNRALRPEGLLHSRGIARSGLRPLTKIPYCCLPQESGPCLSPNVAVRPLRPAMHHRLGGPLPRQPTNAPQVHPRPIPERMFHRKKMPPSCTSGFVLRFQSVFPVRGQVPYVLLTRSPLETRRSLVRLACIRHAASVHPEPGSNSPFKLCQDAENRIFNQSKNGEPYLMTPANKRRSTFGSIRSSLLLALVYKKTRLSNKEPLNGLSFFL